MFVETAGPTASRSIYALAILLFVSLWPPVTASTDQGHQDLAESAAAAIRSEVEEFEAEVSDTLRRALYVASDGRPDIALGNLRTWWREGRDWSMECDANGCHLTRDLGFVPNDWYGSVLSVCMELRPSGRVLVVWSIVRDPWGDVISTRQEFELFLEGHGMLPSACDRFSYSSSWSLDGETVPVDAETLRTVFSPGDPPMVGFFEVNLSDVPIAPEPVKPAVSKVLESDPGESLPTRAGRVRETDEAGGGSGGGLAIFESGAYLFFGLGACLFLVYVLFIRPRKREDERSVAKVAASG